MYLGTGKSFTISAINNLIKNSHKRCAPTAFLIKGENIHSTFFIGCDDKEANLEIKGAKLKNLQEKILNVTHIIIDKNSMISQIILGQIDKRLRQATGKHELFFGGLSIIII